MNNQFYEQNKQNKKNKLDLPINLWGHVKSKKINVPMCDAGFHVIADLPLLSGKIDVTAVQRAILQLGSRFNVYLTCHGLQVVLSSEFGSICRSSYLVHPELLVQSKCLGKMLSASMLSTTKWEHFFLFAEP